MRNQNWTRGLWRMNIVEEMTELIMLWEKLQYVHLVQASGSIRWNWTTSGTYTTKSAYAVQFRGSFCTFNTQAIRRAHAEGKH
jgi:hypothetical protein